MSESAEEIVRDLIKITPHPCLLDIQNDSLQSSLHLAVLVANVRIVRMLLLAGAEVSKHDLITFPGLLISYQSSPMLLVS